tara:strand:- start:305 stop:748 length:444 start_codon:yes stop_codon:yes gene_type:complete
MSQEPGQLQNYSVDQVAGAFVLCMGAIASLLLVVWQSKCHCKCNLCYIFQCERRPPSEEEMKGLKDQMEERAEKQDKKENEILDKEEEILDKVPDKKVPKNMEQLQYQEEITLDLDLEKQEDIVILPPAGEAAEPEPEPEMMPNDHP